MQTCLEKSSTTLTILTCSVQTDITFKEEHILLKLASNKMISLGKNRTPFIAKRIFFDNYCINSIYMV